MAIPINSNSSANVTLVFYGGVEPYSPCVEWDGYYTVPGGTAVLQISGTGSGPSFPGTPWVQTERVCPSGYKGSFTGTFRPNGYSGSVSFAGTVTDAVGIRKKSNYLNFQVVGVGSLLVNAGPDLDYSLDQTVTRVFLSNGSVAGGTPPYSTLWSIPGVPVVNATALTGTTPRFGTPTAPYFDTANWLGWGSDSTPKVATLSATDSLTPVPLTGSDTRVITPFAIGFDVTWLNTVQTNGYRGTATLVIDGGTGPFRYEVRESLPGYATPFSGTLPLGVRQKSWGFTVPTCPYPSTYNNSVVITDLASGFETTVPGSFYNHCLVEGTPILLADGTYRNVEDLLVGDDLLSNSITTDDNWKNYQSSSPDFTKSTTKIAAMQKYTTSSYVDINNGLLKVSGEHPVLVYISTSEYYIFKYTADLIVGDIMINGDGEFVDINSITVVNQPDTNIYSIDTEPWDTYIANNLIVHNKTSC